MSEIKKILDERGSRYGEFQDVARISQNIKSSMHDGSWDELSSDKMEALEMIANKLARIINGDPEYKDSWTDISGYAKLVEDSLD